MPDDVVIRVSNLSKKYLLDHQQKERYTALRDVITGRVRSLGRRVLSPLHRSSQPVTSPSREEFYALKDVSFEVRRGDRIGIIGRNGAGKSTLLKVLSRITEPTSGRIEITGRVASLLEVGTGFHPELSGRENIFLNGAILGMTKAEIKRKFDEIVDFAEVEKFLDTPVKRYSSGMYVRLAFAVAAHLDPEILIVDEVLSVGDAEFQKKCLGKMGDVAREGRTVLFVSHNMVAVQNLCGRAVHLNKGKIAMEGRCEEVVDHYLSRKQLTGGMNEGFFQFEERTQQLHNTNCIVHSLELCDVNLNRRSSFRMGETILFRLHTRGLSAFPRALIGITIKNSFGQWLGSFNSGMKSEYEDGDRDLDEYAVLELDRLPYTPGLYLFDIQVANKRDRDFIQFIEDAGSFEIVTSDVYGNGYTVTNFYGLTFLDGVWRFSNANDS